VDLGLSTGLGLNLGLGTGLNLGTGAVLGWIEDALQTTHNTTTVSGIGMNAGKSDFWNLYCQ
jgi:hypothetical protein